MSGKRFEDGRVSSLSQSREARITVIADVNTPAEQARKRLEQVGAVVSMSRKGNGWDNAAMESFFGSLKEECIGNRVYSSYEQGKQALFEYLEIYYTRQI